MSILSDVKHFIGGISPDDNTFDADILIAINAAFNALTEIGVGPWTGFSVHDNITDWSALTGSDKMLENVRTYVCLRARLIFDPPSNSFIINALKEECKEIEFRISVHVDPVWSEEEESIDG